MMPNPPDASEACVPGPGEPACPEREDSIPGVFSAFREVARTKASPASVQEVHQALTQSDQQVAAIAAGLQQTAEALVAGRLAQSGRSFGAVVKSLQQFLILLQQARTHLGGKSAVVQLYQRQLLEQLDQLEKARQQMEVEVMADLLQYEMVPLFAGWEGMCRILLAALPREEGEPLP